MLQPGSWSLGEKGTHYIKTIKNSSNHLATLINDILDAAAMAKGKLLIKQDLQQLLQSVTIECCTEVLSQTHLEWGGDWEMGFGSGSSEAPASPNSTLTITTDRCSAAPKRESFIGRQVTNDCAPLSTQVGFETGVLWQWKLALYSCPQPAQAESQLL